MQVQATSKYVHMSCRKVRLVADMIRGMRAQDAVATLRATQKLAATPLEKTLASAIANAEHNFKLKAEDLIVSHVSADKGPVMKRWRARAFGRAASIHKHMCHIRVAVSDGTTQVATSSQPAASSEVVAKEAPSKNATQKKVVEAVPVDAPSPVSDAPVQEIVDERREGKHRHKQHSDKRTPNHKV